MSRHWTARIVLTVLTLQGAFLVSMFQSKLPLFKAWEEKIFGQALVSLKKTDINTALFETQSDGSGWSLRPLQSETLELSDWGIVRLADSAVLFDSAEPQPSEYGVLFGRAYRAGARNLVISHQLRWDDAEGLELRALDLALRPFESVGLPVSLSEVPRPSRSPSWLDSSVLNGDSIVGDSSKLPIMNQVDDQLALNDSELKLQFGFPDFGLRDTQYRTDTRKPLLVKWGDGFLPSWSLSLAMKLTGVEAEGVTFEPGNHLRLGATGPVIPIDNFGRARWDELGEITWAGGPKEYLAKSLFPIGEVDLPELPKNTVLLDERNESLTEQSDRLWTEAFSLLQFPRPGKEVVFNRLSLGWELFLYLEIALFGIVALHLRRVLQFIVMICLCFGLVAFCGGLLMWQSLWTPVIPLLVAVVIAWCLVGYLQQIAHPVSEKRVKRA